MEIINFDDFSKLNIRVGKIITAEDVEGSNKLIKMKVDIGDEERQIVAGISKYYSLNELTNKTVIVLINLEPRKIFGIESQGMLLASIDEDKVSLLQTDKEMIPGSEIG
ncbi:MAG: methionine--tRNA ligase subunit beta [Nitrososphaerales archaeon]